MLKKILATALAAAMIFGLASTAFAAAPFPDTAGASNEAVIARLKALGITKGDDLGKFNPTNPINRAEFTTMVVRMLGLEAAAGYINTPTVFPDVTAQYSWAYGYINIASGRGLIKGYEDGTFRPGANVTQAEALTILLRAAGYSDNLPGSWPIDYVMQGATLEVIETGFSSDVAATRALIASLVNNTLGVKAVKEDTEHLGTFDVQLYTVYENSFGLDAGDTFASGKVSAVDTDDLEITIDGAGTYSYVSGVAIYGKDTISALKGQFVKATFNDDGDIVFVTVTTKQEVVGDVTAVDTVDNKVTVGGTAYATIAAPEVIKNGETLVAGTAANLTAVKGCSAKLLLNSDGKVYRIEASVLDKTGSITSKGSTILVDGTTSNAILVAGDNAGTYKLTSSTTVIRNGASATFADLKTDDDLKFSAKTDGTLVYLDAFANVVEGYKVLAFTQGTTDSIKTIKSGTETTFVLDDDFSFAFVLNSTYDLTLNRDGKIIAAEVTTISGPVDETVKTIASKERVLDSDDNAVYQFTFTDGTKVVLDDVTFHVASRMGVSVDAVQYGGDGAGTIVAADVWGAAKAGDLYWLVDSAGAPVDDYDLALFASSLKGRVVRAGLNNDYEIYTDLDGDGTTEATELTATFTTSWSVAVKLNGDAVDPTTPPVSAVAPGASSYTATVTFASTAADVEPKVTGVTLEKFFSSTGLPVKQVSQTGDDYEVTLANPAGDVVLSINVDTTLVYKGGSLVTPAVIAIGDKVKYDADPAAYVVVSADTTAPDIDTDGYAYDAGTDTVTLDFDVDEIVKKVVVTVGGVATEMAVTSGTYNFSLVGVLTDPGLVNITVTDYAGNISTMNASLD